MNINDFMGVVKRETQYGTPSLLTDQNTLDVLNEINIRRKRIWGKYDWKWTQEKLSFAVTQGQDTYVVAAASGNKIDRITSIIPYDTTVVPNVLGEPLIELDAIDFFKYIANQTLTTDIPTHYTQLGQDANGNWNIKIWRSPSSGFTMTGYAKKILKTFLLLDVTANNPFDYFPDGIVEDVLLDGVKAGIYEIMGNKVEAARLDASFEAKLKQLVKEQANVGTDDSGITSPPPDAIRFKYRQRRSAGTGVY